LCSTTEFGCYENIKKEKYGNSIIRLCEKFKSNNYQTIINNIMGDNFQVGDITNNSGQINVGKSIKSKTEVNGNDEQAEKSLNWTKWGVIIATILGVAAIIATIIYS
jgi:hypothetical protein